MNASKELSRQEVVTTAQPRHLVTPPPYSKLYPDLSGGAKQDLDAAPTIGSTLARVLGWGKGTSFQAIADKFNSLDEVSNAVRRAGLESSNLIFGEY